MQRRYIPMALFTASVCPSIWGWNAELIRSLEPDAANNAFQNADVDIGSRSETMDVGMLCRRTISAKKTRATDSAVYGCPKGMKCAYFEK
jgi:hypothetical protein